MQIELGPVCVGSTVRRTPHNQSNMRMHWAQKHKWNKAWKEQVGWKVRESGILKAQDCRLFASVSVVLYKTRLYDRDGAYNAAKPIVDGLTEVGAIQDDSQEHIDLRVLQEKVSKKSEEKVVIHIKRIDRPPNNVLS